MYGGSIYSDSACLFDVRAPCIHNYGFRTSAGQAKISTEGCRDLPTKLKIPHMAVREPSRDAQKII